MHLTGFEGRYMTITASGIDLPRCGGVIVGIDESESAIFDGPTHFLERQVKLDSIRLPDL